MPDEPRDLTVERYLDGLQWPANQNEVVDHLRRKGAPERVVERVQELPKNDFRSDRDLADAFHGSGKWRGSLGHEGQGP